MSTNPAQSADSPYTRENFFGDDGTDTPGPERAPDRDWGHAHHFKEYDVEEVIAHRILRESATMLCAETLWGDPYNGGQMAELWALVFDDECIDGRAWKLHMENSEVELSDPQHPMPKHEGDSWGTHEYGQHRHRARVNPKTGYLTMGETTGVVIQDRSEDEFLNTVREWLSGRGTALTEDQMAEVVRYARRLKRGGDLRDQDIMTKVVEKVRSNDLDSTT